MAKILKEYPHGDRRRYRHRACRCTPCTRAASAARKNWEDRKTMGINSDRELVDAAFTVAQVQEWLKTYEPLMISDFSGLRVRDVRGIARGEDLRFVQASTERSVRAATPEFIAQRYVPAGPARQWLYSLAAQGYPPSWVMERIGFRGASTSRFAHDFVAAEVHEALYAEYLEIRDMPAADNPAADLTGIQIYGAQKLAKQKGYRTPDWYNDKGGIITAKQRRKLLSAARRREQALRGVEILRLGLNGLTDNQIARELNCDDRAVYRWRAELAGLAGTVTEAGTWVITNRARAREIEAGLNWLLATPSADPADVLQALGVMSGHTSGPAPASAQMAMAS